MDVWLKALIATACVVVIASAAIVGGVVGWQYYQAWQEEKAVKLAERKFKCTDALREEVRAKAGEKTYGSLALVVAEADSCRAEFPDIRASFCFRLWKDVKLFNAGSTTDFFDKMTSAAAKEVDACNQEFGYNEPEKKPLPQNTSEWKAATPSKPAAVLTMVATCEAALKFRLGSSATYTQVDHSKAQFPMGRSAFASYLEKTDDSPSMREEKLKQFDQGALKPVEFYVYLSTNAIVQSRYQRIEAACSYVGIQGTEAGAAVDNVRLTY